MIHRAISDLRGDTQALTEVARRSADPVLLALSKHTMDQQQLLLRPTVVKGRLMGINPCGAPGFEVAQRHVREQWKG